MASVQVNGHDKIESFVKLGGLDIPIFGAGANNKDDRKAEICVTHAINAGFRLIDTSEFQNNLIGVGKAIANCKVDRKELFVVGKIWRHAVEGVDKVLVESLKKLGIEYFDLFMICNPMIDQKLEIYQKLLSIKEEGTIIKEVGVCNFYPQHFDYMINKCIPLPTVNGLELHLYRKEEEVVKYCKKQGMIILAHCPLAGNFKINCKPLKAMSEALKQTTSQIMLRWSLQNGFIPIVGSASSAELNVSNAGTLKFSLSDKDMEELGAKKNQQATQKASAKPSSAKKPGAGKAKKKNWTKGKVRDKLSNATLIPADGFEKVKTDVANLKLITISTVSERFKLKGSVAKRLICVLAEEGAIKPIIRHSRQWVYTKTSA